MWLRFTVLRKPKESPKIPRPGICGRDPAGRLLLSVLWKPHPAVGKNYHRTAAPNPEMGDGWLEHGYQVVATPLLEVPYTGQAKWWTPNDNSTCVQVGEEDFSLCEELILKPYFGVTVEQLLKGRPHPPSDIGGWWPIPASGAFPAWRWARNRVTPCTTTTTINDASFKFFGSKAWGFGDRL